MVREQREQPRPPYVGVLADPEDAPRRRVRLHEVSPPAPTGVEHARGGGRRGCLGMRHMGAQRSPADGNTRLLHDEHQPFPVPEREAGRTEGDVQRLAVLPLEPAFESPLLWPGKRLGGLALVVELDHLGECVQAQLGLGKTRHLQEEGVREGAGPVDDYDHALGGGFHEGAVSLPGCPHSELRGRPAPLDGEALLHQECQDQGEHGGHAQGKGDEVSGQGRNLGIYIVEVNSCTYDPVPGREAAHVGKLGGDVAPVVLPLPQVLDVTLLLFAHRLDEFHEELEAVLVPVIAEVPAFELTPVGVHDHARDHVGDPEVVLALPAVPYVADAVSGASLGRLEAGPAEPRVLGILGEDAGRRKCELPYHLLLAVEEHGPDQGRYEGEKDGEEKRQGGQGGEDYPQGKSTVSRRPFRGGHWLHRLRARDGRTSGQKRAETPPLFRAHLETFVLARDPRFVEIAAGAGGQALARREGKEDRPLVLPVLPVQCLDAVKALRDQGIDEFFQDGGIVCEDERMCKEGRHPETSRQPQCLQGFRRLRPSGGWSTAPGPRPRDEGCDSRAVRAQGVGEQVRLTLRRHGRELDAVDAGDPLVREGLAELRRSRDAVMVGERRVRDTLGRHARGQFHGRQRSVAERRVGVEVDPRHATPIRPSCPFSSGAKQPPVWRSSRGSRLCRGS